MATFSAPPVATRKPWQRILRFRLRTLLLVIALAALFFNWVRLAHRQQEIVRALHGSSDGFFFTSVLYDWDIDQHGRRSDAELPLWQQWLGPDYFHSVVQARVYDPEGKFSLLAELPRLRWLHLSGDLSDASLSELQKLPRLRGLSIERHADQEALESGNTEPLANTPVGPITDAGLAHLADLADLEKLELHLSPCCTQASVNSLKNLANLRELYLVVEAGAKVHDGFAALGELPQLTRLIIDAQGEVEFTDIGRLGRLEELVIHNGHKLTNEHLQRLADVAPLKRLLLSDCSQVTLAPLGEMQHLELAQIVRCSAVGSDQMQLLAKLPRLSSLLMHANEGWGSNQTDFWDAAESICFQDAPIPKAALPGTPFPNLQEVTLVDHSPVRMTDFRGMDRLVELHIANCRDLIADDAACEAPLKELRSLSLVDIALEVAEVDPNWLRLWGSVQVLNLFDYVPQNLFENLYKLPNLQSLTIASTKKEIDEILLHVGRCNALRALKVEDSERFTGDGLSHLTALPQLEELKFWSCENLNGNGLANVSLLTHIKALDINHCTLATYNQIVDAPALETLHYDGLVTDADLPPLASHPKLQKITLENVRGVTNAGVAQLTQCQSLTSLELMECQQLTGQGLLALRALRRLAALDIGDAALGIEKSAELASLRRALPTCDIKIYATEQSGCVRYRVEKK